MSAGWLPPHRHGTDYSHFRLRRDQEWQASQDRCGEGTAYAAWAAPRRGKLKPSSIGQVSGSPAGALFDELMLKRPVGVGGQAMSNVRSRCDRATPCVG